MTQLDCVGVMADMEQQQKRFTQEQAKQNMLRQAASETGQTHKELSALHKLRPGYAPSDMYGTPLGTDSAPSVADSDKSYMSEEVDEELEKRKPKQVGQDIKQQALEGLTKRGDLPAALMENDEKESDVEDAPSPPKPEVQHSASSSSAPAGSNH